MYAGKLTPQQRDQIIRKLQPTGAYLIRMAPPPASSRAPPFFCGDPSELTKAT
jgi:hypothetical protein